MAATPDEISRIVAEAISQLSGTKEQAKGTSLTVRDFFQLYMERHATVHTRSAKLFAADFRLYLSETLGDRSLSKITRADILNLQTNLVHRISKSAANKATELLSMLYNKAIEWELLSINPAARIKKFKLKSRERFLLPEELPRFIGAVKSLRHQTSTDLFLMLLYTAQRRRNVCEMKWDDLDLVRKVWHIPQTKNGTSHNVPLVDEAVNILKNRMTAEGKHKEWVFPKRDGSGPVWSLDMAWRSVLDRAQIKGLRIHDLRRSHASWQAITGSSLVTIGATLNHKDPKSTLVYARLFVEPIRESMQEAVDAMQQAGRRLSTEEEKRLRLVPVAQRGALMLIKNDRPTEGDTLPPPPRNAGYVVSGAEQERLEAVVLKMVAEKPMVKSAVYKKLGGFRFNGFELQRVLDELVARGLVTRFREAPNWTVWRYAAAPIDKDSEESTKLQMEELA